MCYCNLCYEGNSSMNRRSLAAEVIEELKCHCCSCQLLPCRRARNYRSKLMNLCGFHFAANQQVTSMNKISGCKCLLCVRYAYVVVLFTKLHCSDYARFVATGRDSMPCWGWCLMSRLCEASNTRKSQYVTFCACCKKGVYFVNDY